MRKHMSSVNSSVDTKFGKVTIMITDGNQVYMEGENLSVRGMVVRATLHVTFVDGGKATITNNSGIYTSRRDDWRKDVSSASEKAITEEYLRVITDFYTDPANADLFRQARLVHLNNTLLSKEEKAAELQKNLDQLNAEIAAYQRDYDAVEQFRNSNPDNFLAT